MMFFNEEKGYHQVVVATPEVLQMERRAFSWIGLTGNYDDFFEVGGRPVPSDDDDEAAAAGTAAGESCGVDLYRIVSINQEKLKGFCGWINRLTT